MDKKIKFLNALSIMVIIFGLLVIVPGEVKATIDLSDWGLRGLELSGFARYEFGIHTGLSNPNLEENNKLQLSRFFLQNELTYKPSEQFKLFANIRVMEDTTSLWDSSLQNYNAFPVDVPKDKDLMMRMGHTDHFRAEVWELYADASFGDLWLRLGRQQFAWGEMIGARVLDCIYPLDLSWNMVNEPEEFELVRIPEWTIRGIYNLKSFVPSCVNNPTFEAFVIPGDVYPNIYADRGAPFFLVNLPSFFKINYLDRRGDPEWGMRLGAGAAGFYGTLDYVHVYNQDMCLKFTNFLSDGLAFDAKYPSKDQYGATLNYAFAHPYNVVITFEGLYSPKEPWADAHPSNMVADIREQGLWTYALRLDRNTWVWPKTFLAPSMMMCTLELINKVVEGNPDNITYANDKVHKSMEWWVLSLQQPLLHGTLTPSVMFIYDTRDCHLLKPAIQYNWGDHWYFNVWGTVYGGKCKTPYDIYGSSYWQNTMYGRITYQF